MIKKLGKAKAKAKGKRVLLTDVDPAIKDCLNCAMIFEQVIMRAVIDLKPMYPQDSIQSAGLALALASLTDPDSRRFAKMIQDVTKAAIKDFQKVKMQLMEVFSSGSKFLH